MVMSRFGRGQSELMRCFDASAMSLNFRGLFRTPLRFSMYAHSSPEEIVKRLATHYARKVQFSELQLPIWMLVDRMTSDS